MKAAVVSNAGPNWEIREVPTPTPGPGEVLVRVRACGLCHNDVLVGQKRFPFLGPGPIITGHEAAGEVVGLGADVRNRRIGDRVGVPWMQGSCGQCAYCATDTSLTGQTAMGCASPRTTGVTVQGGHAEYVVASASGTVLLPDGLSYEVAAPVLCAGYTAWSALTDAAPGPNERVAVVGLGGVGHMAVQYASACGLETLVVTGNPEKAGTARELGAANVVTSGTELAEIGGADVIIAVTPSASQASEALQGLRRGGHFVVSGIFPDGSLDLGPRSTFWARRQRISGSTHAGPARLAEALDLVASGRVTPMFELFSKDRIEEAVTELTRGTSRFRAVITY